MYPKYDDEGFCTSIPDPTRHIPSMESCIEDGHYVYANTTQRRTLIGVLQRAEGDRGPEIMKGVNGFLQNTRHTQIAMFGEHLPPMAIGGPDPANPHYSRTFYDLSEPDSYACDAQDERDYRHQTMTSKQLSYHEARMTTIAASLKSHQARQPDTALNTLSALNKAKSTPSNTPLPAKSRPPPRPLAQQDSPATSSNTFHMTPLPGSALQNTQVQVAATTPTSTDTRVKVTVEDTPPNTKTKHQAATPQHPDDTTHPDRSQQAPSSESGSTAQDTATQPPQPSPTGDPLAAPTQHTGTQSRPVWQAQFHPGTWTNLSERDSERLSEDIRNNTFTEAFFIDHILFRTETPHDYLISCVQNPKGHFAKFPLRPTSILSTPVQELGSDEQPRDAPSHAADDHKNDEELRLFFNTPTSSRQPPTNAQATSGTNTQIPDNVAHDQQCVAPDTIKDTYMSEQ